MRAFKYLGQIFLVVNVSFFVSNACAVDSNGVLAADPLPLGSTISTFDPRGAEYTFRNSNGDYFYSIRHTDGSGGEYPLRLQEGGKLFDINSRFGEYYIIREGRVEVYDKLGFIRDWKIE